MEFVTNLATAFVLSYFWMTIITVKTSLVDGKNTTPKEFWIWIAVGASALLAGKYLF